MSLSIRLAAISLVAILLQQYEALAFITSTIFNIKVVPEVRYLKDLNAFSYSYQIENGSSSQQDIADFGISYSDLALISHNSPDGWRAYSEFGRRNTFLWYSRFENYDIKRGRSKTGLTLVSRSIPSIQNFYARSSFKYSPESEDELVLIDEQNLTNFYNNSKSGPTVGPGNLPSSNAQEIIRQLTDLKHKSYSLGWISNQGIVQSLDKKLDAISSSIAMNRMNTARNEINAFINELDAQKGKHVDNSAYSLLEPTAQYLYNRLR
jgi:hypothetical protein